MTPSTDHPPILVIDDNRDIHADFRKVLCGKRAAAPSLGQLEAELFGATTARAAANYELRSAFSGEEAVDLTRRQFAEGVRFALAFVDMRMPPGWDGMRTMAELQKIDPDIQFVVCSAYSDHTPGQVYERLDVQPRHGILFIRKPFVPAEVRDIAARFTSVDVSGPRP
jgi:CheY-like chemotaxis protein